MQTIKINKISQEEVNLIADYLKCGLVVAYPTDTVYGLGCDARNAEAIGRVNKIKGERGAKPLLVLISNFKMLKKYCFVNSAQMEYLEKIWPGQVTLILRRRPGLPNEQPGGRLVRSGGAPGMVISREPLTALWSVRDASKPCV